MERFPFITTPQKSTKRQKAAIGTKRGAILGQDELPTVQRKLVSLAKPPDVLSSWIGANPRNIVQLASSRQLTGFNEIAWRDKNGSKLYLENLDSVGVINEGLKVTYPDVKSLGQMSGWKNSLPDTIVVKSAGGPMIRMAAKKMVLGLLDSYQSDLNQSDLNQSDWKLPNKPILKETKTDKPGGEFAIELSVKGITQIEPIMRLDTFGLKYSHLFPEPLLRALKTYQDNLKAGVVNGFRVEEVAATREGVAARGMLKEINGAALGLQSALEAEVAENKKRTKVTAGPGLDTLKKSLAILETLQTQVESAIKDGFRNEFDTRRWQQWRALNPRTEDEIVPGTGEKAGKGLQGPVFKYELDPELARRPVVVKYDSNGLNDNAISTGISELNPQQSVRAVAAFEISQKLNLSVIPKTEFFVGTDADGRPKLGQAMEFVNGAIGQRTVGVKNIATPKSQKEIQAYEDMVNNPGNQHPLEVRASRDALNDYVKVNGTWYRAQVFPVDIEFGDPVVQKGLSDLQVFDYIIGHADRNPGNWIYEKQGNTITGVKGIDNDDTFGERWSPYAPGMAIRGIPPIVDISTALSILNADFKDIRPFLDGLSNEEINKAAERFGKVKQEIEQRVMAGQIASMGDVDPAKLQQLRDKVPVMGPMPAILRWDNLGIPGDHNETNSYLGFQLARKTELAQLYPKYPRGALQESEDDLVEK